MELRTDEKNRCISVSGRIDTNTCNELDQKLMAIMESSGSIIIDLSLCPYLSSAGIRVLLKAKKQLRSTGADLILAGVTPPVFHVLEISDLHRLMKFEKDIESAIASLQAENRKETETISFESGHHTFIYTALSTTPPMGQIFTTKGISSMSDLGFAIGFGHLSGAATEKHGPDLFVSMQHCCGFFPAGQPAAADFRIVGEPSKSGIDVAEALSFGGEPSGFLKLEQTGMIPFKHLMKAVGMAEKEHFQANPATLCIILNSDSDSPSLSVALMPGKILSETADTHGMELIPTLLPTTEDTAEVTGITFLLAEPLKVSEDGILPDYIRSLTLETISEVKPLNTNIFLTTPRVWIFPSFQFVNERSHRLSIETSSGTRLEPHIEFLIRMLYADSTKVLLHVMPGGYVARTFQAISWDHEGRKMRPTVVKAGSREVISREAERCRQYALPFIFNNSAIVLGAEFHGETGALRYNFVGIGEESDRLEWLTTYYKNQGTDFLLPLFDKIFLQILQPWYGQPVKKTIFPYQDHDPVLTFFPHIFNTAKELFSISADDKFVSIPELNKPILNPYWFLKHEYPARRKTGMEYLTGICHGDLNMQNILLDDKMNVFLIDFSETRPRAIIADFARLEAIFMVDYAPVDDPESMHAYLQLIRDFYGDYKLGSEPVVHYDGPHGDEVRKNFTMTTRVRSYARTAANGNPDIIPYYFALLEWVLPVICYYEMPVNRKKLSMIVSSMICEKLI